MRSLRRALPAAVAAMVLALPGCGGDGDEPAADQQPPRDSRAGEARGDGASGAGRAGDAPSGTAGRARPAALGGLAPAAGDLSNFSCEQRGSAWSADGVVSNSAKEQMVYTVTVVTLAGSEVAGHASKEILLEPGESVPFAIRRVSRGDADACMPRVVRAPR